MTTTIQYSDRIHRVYTLLRFTYGLVPIIAGLDKFTNILTNWEKYLNPSIANLLPFSPAVFMTIVGIIEIIAGIIVLVRPSLGAYTVMAWLALIGITLIPAGEYLDVTVRDFVMAIGAYSLAQLAGSVVNSGAGQTKAAKATRVETEIHI